MKTCGKNERTVLAVLGQQVCAGFVPEHGFCQDLPNHFSYPCQRLADKPLSGHTWDGHIWDQHLQPPHPPFLEPLSQGWGEQFQCSDDLCSHLAALRSSALLLMHLPLFSYFSDRNFVSCVFTKSSPWVSRAAGPRYFLGRKVWTHGDVLLGINASRGHTKICRQEKHKTRSVRFVWGVKQSSVGS